MCGRLLQARDLTAYAEHFRIPPGGAAVPNLPPRYNGAPTQDFLVVRRNPHTAQAEFGALRWGLVPVWAKDISIANRTFNARSETVATTASFRGAWRAGRRCLVPVDGFYEWRRAAGGKQPFLIARADGAPIWLAGLWEGWKDPASGEWLRTFTILTCAASPFMAPLHDRMPVIVEDSEAGRWLEAEAPAGLLRAYSPDDLSMRPVSPRLNSVRNEGSELLEPPAGEAPSLDLSL
ncbi:SOS response-associated peptidase [Ancylobacter sp. G4_0304]|uniref:SOS response-associated peptidase n=1 Tax=Ancylobacter sp. G4_0304 TaxID=3114289 RepID=UPI0039C67DAC